MKLYCLGDSLTFGMGVRAEERWTNIVAQNTNWNIINMGINGDTTGGMLTRLHSEFLFGVAGQKLQMKKKQVLLMGGSNDIFYSGSSSGAKANIGAMIHELLAIGISPIIGIPLPVDIAMVPHNWMQAVDFIESAKVIEQYCEWLKRYCAAFTLRNVDFHRDFLTAAGDVRSELLLDGIHPTQEGHKQMAKRLFRLLYTMDGELSRSKS